MRPVTVIGGSVLVLTALIGLGFDVIGLNNWANKFGQEVVFYPLQFALISAPFLVFSLWRNGKRCKNLDKATMLVFPSILFVPVMGLVFQLGIPLMKNEIIANDVFGLSLYLIPFVALLCIGNYASVSRPQGIGGLRNRWTLANRAVWAKTQRLYGRVAMLGALTSIPFALSRELGLALLTLTFSFILSLIVGTAFSIYFAKAKPPEIRV
jgi:uncharacterized membrane protein